MQPNGTEDIELEEEDYGDRGECKADLQSTNHPQQWRSAVNEVCNDVRVELEESNGYRSDTELESLHSDDDDDGKTRKTSKEFNPQRNLDKFKFKLGKEFPTMGHLRHIMDEEFIKGVGNFNIISMIRIELEPNVEENGVNGFSMLRF